MNSEMNRETMLPLQPAWKRVLILSATVLHGYLFIPAMAGNPTLSAAAEAAEAQVGGEGDAKRSRVKAKTASDESRAQSVMRRVLRGKASWYGPRFHGKKTATGEIFDQQKLTAAHKTLPLGTKALVTNLENGNSVQVEINDRGPYVPGRVIDLSYAAAKQLGFLKSGVAAVEVLPLPQTGELS